MNKLTGHITNIKTYEGISLVRALVNATEFTSIVIDTPQTASYLQQGGEVQLIFKETELIIAKDLQPNISIQNRLPCRIASIKKGVLLCEITLIFGQNQIKSIITSKACEELQLKEQEEILALIKTNEISLSAND